MKGLKGILVSAAILACTVPAYANGLITTSNTRIGINDDGSLDANTSDGFIGIGYNFTGQGGRFGFQDALTPGCPCEAWGVSANGITGHVGPNTGNTNISVSLSSAGTNDNSSASATSTFTSNTFLTSLPGLSVTQTFSLGASTATGDLFKDHVVITNTTGAVATDVRFARAMDWDVPPTEFSEFVTHKGTGTTTELFFANDQGFALADPLAPQSEIFAGTTNVDFTDAGPADHGSQFIFQFGNLADGATKEFNIFYGAGLDESDALALLSLISPELYSLGQSNSGSGAANGLPTFVFAFNGVGGSVVVPPLPEPGSMLIFASGLIGATFLRRRSRKA
jgi:type IV pilus assembly protein PilY1